MADYDVKPLITADEIATKIDALAAQINESFKDTEKLIVVGLLRGSFVFIADLARKLTVPVEVDFMVASSYGDSTESSRNVRIIKDLDGQIRARMCFWSKTSLIPAIRFPKLSACSTPAIPTVWKSARF